MSDAPARAAGDEVDWGGFTLGGMSLALPMQALREVAPCAALSPLPVVTRGVVGGLELRGFTMPVLDLAALLDLPACSGPACCAVVVQHEGRLLALRAESVTGVFRARAGSVVRAAAIAGADVPFAGSLRRADTGALVTLLSMEALVALPGVPWIVDPEPARQIAAHEAAPPPDETATGADSATNDDLSLLLMRAGPHAFAIDAAYVHSTLSEPQVAPSPITSPLTPGTVAAHGQRLPAVDLAALCGVGALPAALRRQAVVLRHERGLVVLLVEQVVEIVRPGGAKALPAPTFGVPRPGLVAGVFPGRLISADRVVAPAVREGQYLLIDGDVLCGLPEIVALAATGVPDAAAAATAAMGDAEGARDGRAVITFLAPSEMAVPIEQVREILAGVGAAAPLDAHGLVSRLVVQADRAVPVVRLERLFGRPFDASADAPVLVVQADDAVVGFEVTALRSIEHTHWEQTMYPPGGDLDAHGARRGHTLVTVGRGTGARTIPLVDLAALVRTVAGETLPAGGLDAAA